MKKRTKKYIFGLIKKNPNNIHICNVEIICFLFSDNWINIGLRLNKKTYLHIDLSDNKKLRLFINKSIF